MFGSYILCSSLEYLDSWFLRNNLAIKDYLHLIGLTNDCCVVLESLKQSSMFSGIMTLPKHFKLVLLLSIMFSFFFLHIGKVLCLETNG